MNGMKKDRTSRQNGRFFYVPEKILIKIKAPGVSGLHGSYSLLINYLRVPYTTIIANGYIHSWVFIEKYFAAKTGKLNCAAFWMNGLSY
jgi:hypothetical protein